MNAKEKETQIQQEERKITINVCDPTILRNATLLGMDSKTALMNFFDKINSSVADRKTEIIDEKKPPRTVELTCRESTCNMWTAGRKSHRTDVGTQKGTFKVNGQPMDANRIMFVLCYGIEVEDDKKLNGNCPCEGRATNGPNKGKRKTYRYCCRPEVMNRCKSGGLCTNPLHMRLGTRADNIRYLAQLRSDAENSRKRKRGANDELQ